MEKIESLFISEEEIKGIDTKLVLNVNIGVMGHIDSGKTSLVRELTRIVSTAALDKNPQSQERGITLDLGFSAFFTKFPEEKADSPFKYIQFTLVDCPGHASLIKTIIGGASIIDLMFLVIDVNKGIQTQTAECFVIVLNKIDLLPPETREAEVKKRSDELRQKFSKTRFGPNIPIIPVSANVGSKEVHHASENIDVLIKTLLTELRLPKRSPVGDFYFLIDHCFPIKGQGSVVTGTVISGGVKVGAEVEFPVINERKKVKSIQMFKKPIEKAFQGDRIGMLFAQLDNKLIERGIACQPGAVRLVDSLIINISRIPYFKKEFTIKSKSKFHITSGHQTVMGTINLFQKPLNEAAKKPIMVDNDQDSKYSLEHKSITEFSFNEEYEYYDELRLGNDPNRGSLLCYIEFEKSMIANLGSFIIGSKLDMDVNSKNCRLAFHGNVLAFIKVGKEDEITRLRIFKEKFKRGTIEKIIDNHTVLVKNLFKKETDLDFFKNKDFCLGNLIGKFHSTFGKSGKIKIVFEKNIFQTFKVVNPNSKQAKEVKPEEKMVPPEEEFKETELEEMILKTDVVLKYRKYMFQNK